jgi:hypothetical protein
MRPGDDAFDGGCSAKTMSVYIGGAWSDRFERLNRVEIAGFIPETVSHFDVTGKIGLYYGDDRDFSYDDPIPVDGSRFFMRLDFASDVGFVHVSPTHAANGACGSAWPISFNSRTTDDLLQSRNYFSLGSTGGGSELRLGWSVVHGDRRLFSGVFPTPLVRPSFDGSLSMRWTTSESLEFAYNGDCFPSVEAQIVPANASRYTTLQMASRGALWGVDLMPDCSVISSGNP